MIERDRREKVRLQEENGATAAEAKSRDIKTTRREEVKVAERTVPAGARAADGETARVRARVAVKAGKPCP